MSSLTHSTLTTPFASRTVSADASPQPCNPTAPALAIRLPHGLRPSPWCEHLRALCVGARTQALVVASTQKVAVEASPELEEVARRCWRSAAYGSPVSLSHARVVVRLRSLGLAPQVWMSSSLTAPPSASLLLSPSSS